MTTVEQENGKHPVVRRKIDHDHRAREQRKNERERSRPKDARLSRIFHTFAAFGIPAFLPTTAVQQMVNPAGSIENTASPQNAAHTEQAKQYFPGGNPNQDKFANLDDIPEVQLRRLYADNPLELVIPEDSKPNLDGDDPAEGTDDGKTLTTGDEVTDTPTPEDPIAPFIYTVTSDGLNFRSEPNRSADIVTVLSNGQVLTPVMEADVSSDYLPDENGIIKVREGQYTWILATTADGSQGWFAEEYTQQSENPALLVPRPEANATPSPENSQNFDLTPAPPVTLRINSFPSSLSFYPELGEDSLARFQHGDVIQSFTGPINEVPAPDGASVYLNEDGIYELTFEGKEYIYVVTTIEGQGEVAGWVLKGLTIVDGYETPSSEEIVARPGQEAPDGQPNSNLTPDPNETPSPGGEAVAMAITPEMQATIDQFMRTPLPTGELPDDEPSQFDIHSEEEGRVNATVTIVSRILTDPIEMTLDGERIVIRGRVIVAWMNRSGQIQLAAIPTAVQRGDTVYIWSRQGQVYPAPASSQDPAIISHSFRFAVTPDGDPELSEAVTSTVHETAWESDSLRLLAGNAIGLIIDPNMTVQGLMQDNGFATGRHGAPNTSDQVSVFLATGNVDALASHYSPEGAEIPIILPRSVIFPDPEDMIENAG